MLQRGKNGDVEPSTFLKSWFYVYGKDFKNPVDFFLIIVVRKEADE